MGLLKIMVTWTNQPAGKLSKHNNNCAFFVRCGPWTAWISWTISTFIFLVLSSWPRSAVASKGLYSISITSLDNLAYTDLKLVQNLTHYHGNSTDAFEKKRLRYLKDFKEGTGLSLGMIASLESLQLMSRARKNADNPVIAYRLIWRAVYLLEDLLKHAPTDFVFPLVPPNKDLYILPDKDDLVMAMVGIFSISIYYQLPVEKLANGVVSTFSTGASLNAVHCIELGVWARAGRFFAQSVEWLELALEKIVRLNDTTAKALDAREQLGTSIAEHDKEYLERYSMREENPRYFKDFVVEQTGGVDFCSGEAKKCIRPRREKQGLNEHLTDQGFKSEFLDPFYSAQICNGKDFRSERKKSELFCWREFKVHPKFQIGPMNMEFLFRDPDVVQIYNFSGDGEIEEMKDMILTYQPTYSLGGPNQSKLETDRIFSVQPRVGSASNIFRRTDNATSKMLQKIEDVVALEVTDPSSSNDLHIVSYAYTGHYAPHVDSTDRKEGLKKPDFYRIATFMIYLDDVTAGGFTSFSWAGFGARPLKGSALFWFNLKGNGVRMNPYTTHGACPPLIGRKTILTSWIKYPDQFLKAPCPLNKKANFAFRVNGEYPK